MSERESSNENKNPEYWDGHTIKDGHHWTNMHRLAAYDKTLNPIVIIRNTINEGRYSKLVYETLKDYAVADSVTPIKIYSQGETFDPNSHPAGSIVSFTDEVFAPGSLFLRERFDIHKNLAMTLELQGEFDLHRVIYGLVNYDYLGPAGVPKIFPGPVTVGEVNHGFYNVNRITSLNLIQLGKAVSVPDEAEVKQQAVRLIPVLQQ